MLAPNNSYGAFSSTTNPPPLVASETVTTEAISVSGNFVCEQTSNIYYASNTAAAFVAVRGYEDNL
jgi:hypothetical protein